MRNLIVYASRDGHDNQILANCTTDYPPYAWLAKMLKKFPNTVLVSHERIDAYAPGLFDDVACFDGLLR